MRRNIITWVLFLFCCTFFQAYGQDLIQKSNHEFTYMWWVHSIKENDPLKFAVKTNRYAFIFDYEKLNFEKMLIKEEDKSYMENFQLSTNDLFTKFDSPGLSFGIETYGQLFPCNLSSLRTEDCQLVHSGRFLQHRFINWIPGLTGCDPHQSGLEIVASSDRLSLLLRVVPQVNLRSKSVVIRFTLPAYFREIMVKEGIKAFKNPQDGSGYIFFKSEDASILNSLNNTVEAKLQSKENFQTGENLRVGMIIYPAVDLDKELAIITAQESNPVLISAVQSAPVEERLEVKYEPDMGWHRISLRNDVTGNIEEDNHRLEKVKFSITNNNPTEATVRLNFAKDANVHGITGISAVIRDENEYPTGIPVQLSKNWHGVDFNNFGSHLYRGPWYHGITVLKIPAKTKITFEYLGIGAFWGNVPAVSHAQLCLVGWGQNQLWEQSAIGSWGENICYEPDLDQASAPALDIRPLLVVDPKGEKWRWTGNVGGADFINLRKKDGKRAWHTEMRTHYESYCPNLTQVSYAGNMLNGDVKIKYTTSIYRSDDMTRGLFKIRMDVIKDIEFDELAIFQMAASTYHYALSERFAWGNESGVKKEWKAANGDQSTFIGNKTAFTGKTPWVSMSGSPISPDQTGKFVGGDRGFIIRNWNVKIKGQTNIPPHWQEYVTAEGNHGNPSSIINVTLPEGQTSLSAGDFIEADVELVVLPLRTEDYYGPNVLFKKALNQYAGKWRMVHREAVGNQIKVGTTVGEAENNYPVVVKTEHDKAQFKIKGGIGYVPITIKGLSSYRNPVMLIKDGNKWTKLDQSRYGNDFWQTGFDVRTGTYQITFNMNMDGTSGVSMEKELKFELQ